MKRFLALFLGLLLAFSAPTASIADEITPDTLSYDFDLRFHMNADLFPVRERTRMQGYADLLNMLELKGNLTWRPSTQSFHLNLDIIPVSNPESAVSLLLYGIPEEMGLRSPLLGEETIWFQNPFLMEFAYKTWNNLHIPLQYFVLLFPYVTESAFRQLDSAWSRRFGSARKSTSFSRDDLVSLSREWESILHNDTRLKYWIYSISLPAKQGAVMENEFFKLPDYVLSRVFPKGGLKYRLNGADEIWSNAQGDILFTRNQQENSYDWLLSLPATENGYLPRMSFHSETDRLTGLKSCILEGSYNHPEDWNGDSTSFPDSLLSVSLNMNGWPETLPADTAFDASLRIGGILYPQTDLTLRGASTSAGYLSLTLSEPVEENGAVVDVLSCSGTIVPSAPSDIPDYTLDDFSYCLSIFNVSDSSMDDFVHRIRRPLFFGILNFLDELPARACQSVMDDLEEYGVLDMVLID